MKNLEIKKKYGIKVIAVTTSFALTVTCLSGCAKTSNTAASSDTSYETSEESETLESQLNKAIGDSDVDSDDESSLSDPDDAPSKDEVVYVMADASGNTDKVVVSDWLKNTKASSDITDVSDLKDITNTKGNENYTLGSDGTLDWNADGKDIHYQGTTDKKLPVDVKVSYKLDGKDIEPDKLAGKSGKVTIRFDYTNNETKTVDINGKQENIKVPFAMISGVMLDSSKFTDVKVTNGKQIEGGKSNVIVGMAFPGLADSIDLDGMKEKADNDDAKKQLDDINIPEYVEITANVKDFSLQQTMTMASSDVISQLDVTSDSIDTTDIDSDMTALSDGMDDLEDGSRKLQEGSKDLQKGTSELASKSKDLDTGASDLGSGAKSLNDGAKSLSDGASSLSDGLCSIDSGAGSLKTGADKLSTGTSSLVSGAGKLDDGAAELQTGINSYSSAVDTYLGSSSALQTGTAQAASTSALLSECISDYITEDNNREANIESTLEKLTTQKTSLQSSLSVSQLSLDEAEDAQQTAEENLIAAAQGDEQVLSIVTGTTQTELSVPVSSSKDSTSSSAGSDSSTSSNDDTGSSTEDKNSSINETSSSTADQTSSAASSSSASETTSTETSSTNSADDSANESKNTSTSQQLVMGYSVDSNDEDSEAVPEGQLVNGSVTVTTPVVESKTVNTVDQEEVQSAIDSYTDATENVVTLNKAIVLKEGQISALDSAIDSKLPTPISNGGLLLIAPRYYTGTAIGGLANSRNNTGDASDGGSFTLRCLPVYRFPLVLLYSS